jgi:tetratricopeptide (TPR) repeat protein
VAACRRPGLRQQAGKARHVKVRGTIFRLSGQTSGGFSRPFVCLVFFAAIALLFLLLIPGFRPGGKEKPAGAGEPPAQGKRLLPQSRSTPVREIRLERTSGAEPEPAATPAPEAQPGEEAPEAGRPAAPVLYGPREFKPGVFLPAPRRGPPDTLLIGVNPPVPGSSGASADSGAGKAFQIETLLHDAWLAQKERKYREALEMLREALSVDPMDDRARIKEAEILMAQGNFSRAAQALAEVTDPGLQDDYYYFLRGEAAYFQERYFDAEAMYRKALTIRENEPASRRIEELQRSTARIVLETAHFTLALPQEMPGYDPKALFDLLEGDYDVLHGFFGVVPGSKIPVIVLSQKEFFSTTGAPDWSRGLYDGKVRIPVSALGEMTPAERRTLQHEIAHALVHIKTEGNCPAWLQEGLAQYSSGERNWKPLADCDASRFPFETKGSDWGKEYAHAVSMVEFLMETKGRERIDELLEKLAGGTPWREVFRQVMLDDPGRWLAEWKTWCLENRASNQSP